ncbi:MAG: rhodanese-like domain-containing protein [Gammaproteobacteria bacterium]|nr:rhodanese-like domain-containing protein [Gammaproteobacteria bacterium]
MKISLIIFVLIIIAFFLMQYLLVASPATDITQDEFIALQKSKENDFLLLDVRTVGEFSQGHIKDAINITHTEIVNRLSDIPKDKDIIIYCRSGKRAAVAANTLEKNGFHKLFHLDGDMNGWVKNNQSIVKGK